jgi:hypothetical protein
MVVELFPPPTAFTPEPVRRRVAFVTHDELVAEVKRLQEEVDLIKLASMPLGDQLKVLGSNPDAGVPKDLKKLTKITDLDLYSIQLTSVKGLEKLTQLTELGLKSNRFRSVKGLENLKRLKYLFLDDNPGLTKAQIDELRKALPDCLVRHDLEPPWHLSGGRRSTWNEDNA